MQKYNLYLEYQGWRNRFANPISINLSLKGDKYPKRQLTGYSVVPECWDDKAKKVIDLHNADFLNAAIAKLKAEVEKLLLRKQLAGLPLTGNELGGHKIPTYAEYAESLGKDGWSSDVTRVRNFCKAQKDLPNEPTLAHLNNAFLRRLKAHEEARAIAEEREHSHNTISVMFDKMISLLNIAASEGLILKEQYSGFKPPKRIDTEHDWLEEAEEGRLMAHARTFDKNDHSKEHMAVCGLLLACNSGLRVSDWQKIIDEQDQRIYPNPTLPGKYLINLNTKKSKSNIVVPATADLREILLRLRGRKIPKDLTAYSRYLHRALVRESVNIPTKKGKSHTGRHTFGFKAASKWCWTRTQLAVVLGVGEDVVAKYFHLTGNSITHQAMSMEEAIPTI